MKRNFFLEEGRILQWNMGLSTVDYPPIPSIQINMIPENILLRNQRTSDN